MTYNFELAIMFVCRSFEAMSGVHTITQLGLSDARASDSALDIFKLLSCVRRIKEASPGTTWAENSLRSFKGIIAFCKSGSM